MYIDTLGMTAEQVKSMGIVLAVIGIIITAVYILLKVKRQPVRSSWAMPAGDGTAKNVNRIALLMPIFPMILVFFFKLDRRSAQAPHPHHAFRPCGGRRRCFDV